MRNLTLQINLAKKLFGTLSRPHVPCDETTEKCLNVSLHHILSSLTVIDLQCLWQYGEAVSELFP